MLHKQRIPLDAQVWEYSEIQSKFQLNTLCPWLNNLGEEREMEGAQTARRTHPFCLSQNILWTQKKDSGILRYTDHQGTVSSPFLLVSKVTAYTQRRKGKDRATLGSLSFQCFTNHQYSKAEIFDRMHAYQEVAQTTTEFSIANSTLLVRMEYIHTHMHTCINIHTYTYTYTAYIHLIYTRRIV